MSQIETKRRQLVSRVAPDRLRAGTRIVVMGALGFTGASLVIVSVTLTPSTTSVILASMGCAMALTGLLGIYIYSKVLDSIIGAEDIVEVSSMPDPAGAGPPVPPLAKKGVAGNRLVVGPVRLGVAQFRLIAEASRKNHWKWARKLCWEDSDANVTNVNKRYGLMTKWMLDEGLLVNEGNNPSVPEYYVTPAGQDMLRDVSSGILPTKYSGGIG